MKSVFKVAIVCVAGLIIAAKTNSCANAEPLACQKKADNIYSHYPAHVEVNAWTLTSKFNF